MRSQIILLVEDNLSDRELAKRVLEKCANLPCELILAGDGQEALDFLLPAGDPAKLGNLPALVLLDLKLPRVAGLDVLRRIRAHARTRLVPVVVLTTSALTMDMNLAYDYGANSFVRKPVSFPEFSRTLERIARYWLTLNVVSADGEPEATGGMDAFTR